MTHKPSKALITGMALLLAAAAALIVYASVAFRTDPPAQRAAADPTTTPTPPVATVEIQVSVPEGTATPVPVTLPAASAIDEPMTFEHDQADLEALARLLWSSPLRGRDDKLLLCWVILNRVDAELGGGSVTECINKTEFPFFDPSAHLSETNMAIAQEVLDLWLSERVGLTVDRMIPEDVLYIRFTRDTDESMEVLTAPGGEAYNWRAYGLLRGVG